MVFPQRCSALSASLCYGVVILYGVRRRVYSMYLESELTAVARSHTHTTHRHTQSPVPSPQSCVGAWVGVCGVRGSARGSVSFFSDRHSKSISISNTLFSTTVVQRAKRFARCGMLKCDDSLTLLRALGVIRAVPCSWNWCLRRHRHSPRRNHPLRGVTTSAAVVQLIS